MEATVADLSERELIARIQKRLPAPPGWVLVGIGDDAAVVEPERNRVEVLSVDCLVDGVHFDRMFVPPAAIGHRALAAGLSDLAAMGAEPRLALLSLALPAGLALADFDGIADGLAALAARCRTHVVGGNLTRTPGPLTIDVIVTGTVKRRQALKRDGARPGDELYVTGSIGAAAAGLQFLQHNRQSAILNPQSAITSQSGTLNPQSAMIERFLKPEPRLRIGMLLARNQIASACIDLSDGLADGVRRIADGSHVGATIDADRLPIDPEAREWWASRDADPVGEAISGGDDYELLFAVRPRLRRRLDGVLRHAAVPVTRIGACTAEGGARLARAAGGDVPMPAGYGHFR